MTKTILITGATDGIGLATATLLAARGHTLLLHGRSTDKVAAAAQTVRAVEGAGEVHTLLADLSDLAEVERLAAEVGALVTDLDVLINNAGVFRAEVRTTPDDLDVRFVVNTISPYLLTQRLLARLGPASRVINLSSAAQAPVDPAALAGRTALADGAAYAQSKLALTMWSTHLARTLAESLPRGGPMVVAVNPGSLLATKMVKDAFGVDGNDLAIGSDILVRAALDDEFAGATGKYYDNDAGRFAEPHPDALDPAKNRALSEQVAAIIDRLAPTAR